jgi:hypothetical protein
VSVYRALVDHEAAWDRVQPNSLSSGGQTQDCRMAERRITGFRQDPDQDWIAELECGHAQHVRHTPPWQVRPWVLTADGRAGRLGTSLSCRQCDEESTRDR